MAPRGLSAAEKRVKMLEIFHETKEFYTLKELEKIAPTQQTVKETLDDLVSDGIVTFDKIGTSNYFWAFPSTAGAQKQAALDKAQNELSDLNKRIAETKAGIISESKGREDTPERQKLLSALQQAHTDRVNLTNELAAYGAADPVKYERKKEAIQVCKDAAVRWTDNTLTVISFLQAQGAEREMIRSMLEDMGIPDQDEWEDLKL